MKFISVGKLLAGAALTMLLFAASGCNTPDPSNRAERPWNAPKGWESGLPVGLTEGR